MLKYWVNSTVSFPFIVNDTALGYCATDWQRQSAQVLSKLMLNTQELDWLLNHDTQAASGLLGWIVPAVLDGAMPMSLAASTLGQFVKMRRGMAKHGKLILVQSQGVKDG